MGFASDPGLDPGQESPRAGWGSNVPCPWGGAAEEEAPGPPRPGDYAFPPWTLTKAEATRISIAEFGRDGIPRPGEGRPGAARNDRIPARILRYPINRSGPAEKLPPARHRMENRQFLWMEVR